MNDAKRKFLLTLIIVLCGTFVHAQQTRSYPANADDIIAIAETISRIDFSVEDAVKRFGEIDENGEPDDWAFDLTPFSSERERIESVRIDTYDKRRKLDAVTIDYVGAIAISYGKLRQKYGKPKPLPLPIVLCRPGDNCRPAFVGYEFKAKPVGGTDKQVGITISLETIWSKTIPKHTDENFLLVKRIRLKRIVED